MKRFADKVVLVTGASTGIGLETISRIQDEGGLVYAAHRRKQTDIDLRGARSLHLDVTDEHEWSTAIDRVIVESGRLDVLINNAGIRESGTIEKTDLKLWYH